MIKTIIITYLFMLMGIIFITMGIWKTPPSQNLCLSHENEKQKTIGKKCYFHSRRLFLALRISHTIKPTNLRYGK